MKELFTKNMLNKIDEMERYDNLTERKKTDKIQISQLRRKSTYL